MAIVFEKQLTLTDLLFSYNNNTVTFKTNSTLTVSKATVSFNGLVFTLFPDPANKFYFNFKYSVSTLLNGTNNFSDQTNLDIVTPIANAFKSRVLNDGGTFESFDCLIAQITELGVNPLIDYTDYIFNDFDVTYKIFFTNDTSETETVTYNFLSAYVNTQDYKKLYPQYPFKVQGQFILKPISYFKSWVGYPFDITYYDGEFGDLYFNVNGNESFLSNDNRINRVVFSNGNEIVALQNGYNSITIIGDEFYIEQISDACDGHYLKWLNSFGGWNYWLFNKGNDTLSTKDLGTIFNDYNDVVDTISPYVAIGKTSENNITVRQDNITQDEFLILNDILESPKVYLFTGVQNEVVQANDWLEVTIKSGAFRVSNAKEKMTNLNLTIELPANNTKTL
jgi:hypothetical protein